MKNFQVTPKGVTVQKSLMSGKILKLKKIFLMKISLAISQIKKFIKLSD